MGQLLKAAECAATYLGMIPSDEVMLYNIRYYTNQYKLQPDDFTPREASGRDYALRTYTIIIRYIKDVCHVCI